MVEIKKPPPWEIIIFQPDMMEKRVRWFWYRMWWRFFFGAEIKKIKR